MGHIVQVIVGRGVLVFVLGCGIAEATVGFRADQRRVMRAFYSLGMVRLSALQGSTCLTRELGVWVARGGGGGCHLACRHSGV